jgi:hypothetical protein
MVFSLLKMLWPFILLAILFKIFYPIIKGKVGEAAVKKNLKTLSPEEYIHIHDIMIPSRDGTTQIDHVVVSPYGIFVVETKNYEGWIYGSENSKYWTQVLNKNSKHKFFNPLRQNYGHVKALEQLLGVTGLRSVVAFVNGTFKTEMPDNVIMWRNLSRYISMFKRRIYGAEQVRTFVDAIVAADIKDRQARKDHIAAIKKIKQAE